MLDAAAVADGLDDDVLAPGGAERPSSAGALIGRSDLADDVLRHALAERLGFDGRDPAEAPVVLEAAKQGEPEALRLLAALLLPAPQASLSMPVQALRREARRFSFRFRLAPNRSRA